MVTMLVTLGRRGWRSKMGILSLTFSGRHWTGRLGAVNTVGRHWSCTHRVEHPRVPMFWLEVRHGHTGWVWRSLEGRGITRGGGTVQAHDWRSLQTPTRRASRVWCGDVGHVRLQDAGPPSSFLTDLSSGVQLAGAELLEILEQHEGAFYRLGEGDEPSRTLVDGDLIVHSGSAWRFAAGAVQQSTDGGRLSDCGRPR